MILIFSSKNDISTQTVQNWLVYNKIKFVLINEINAIVEINISISNDKECLSFRTRTNEVIEMGIIKAVWYRRGTKFLHYGFYPGFKKDLSYEAIYNNFKDEYDAVLDIIFEFLKNKTIGEFSTSNPNKQRQLLAAKRVGLKIPETIICDTKKNSFQGPHINKNITNVINLEIGSTLYYNRTTLQENYPVDNFFPSLFQREIKKKHEIRVFFFLDLFFSMLFTPRKDGILKTDIREVNGKDNLMKKPMKLPTNIEIQVKSLIKLLEYTTGSIDLIVDQNDEFYFLELNPSGQFHNVSIECGYDIEKQIAEKLITYEKTGFDKKDWFKN